MAPSVTFPYKLYKGFACPVIPIDVKGRRGWLSIEAYVDTGASLSVFSAQEAHNLGIRYQGSRVIYSTVGDGSLIPVYLHTLPVRIGHNNFQATIGFSSRLGVGFNLLGRRDIFKHFDITFSEAKKNRYLHSRLVTILRTSSSIEIAFHVSTDTLLKG